ncbi:MAG TPA: hypothetical protein VM487_15960 [Phycisphaerae bacterium]|nr:hypothetical protein [Phycisphaerae bacterium]
MRFTTCVTSAGVLTHLRQLEPDAGLTWAGGDYPALCGIPCRKDMTELEPGQPIDPATCGPCVEEMKTRTRAELDRLQRFLLG